MPESVTPNLIKYTYQRCLKTPTSFTEIKVDKGPSSQGTRALIGLPESKEVTSTSAEDVKMLLINYTILYEHDTKNDHTETKVTKK